MSITSQNLLGKNYKWWYLYQYSIKARLTSKWDSVIFMIGHMLVLSSVILTWWLAGNKQIDLGFQSKLTYFLVGELFYCFVFLFPSFNGFEILRGNHTTQLLFPQSYFKQIFFKYYGDSFIQSLSKFVFLLTTIFALRSLILFQPAQNIFLSFVMIPISLFLLFLLEISVSFSAFWLTRINGIILNFGFLLAIFSGRNFPLNLLVESFGWNLFNPFAFTFYHPMQIYLGKYSQVEIVQTFAGGIIWCLVLFILARIVFKAGLKRNEAVGL